MTSSAGSLHDLKIIYADLNEKTLKMINALWYANKSKFYSFSLKWEGTFTSGSTSPFC